MDFELNDKQKEAVDLAHEFAVNELRPISREYDRKGVFPKELLVPKAAEAGFTTGEIPVEFGGKGSDVLTGAMVLEELFWGDAGMATSVVANNLASGPIIIAGSEEQKKQWLSRLVDGQLACFCLTEPGAGSDVAGIKTTARDMGTHYVINGQKCFITNGGITDFCVVFANADPEMGFRGQTAFIVESSSDGVSMGKKEDKMGIRSSHTAEVIFENVEIPKENIIGRVGQAFYIVMKTFDRTRPGLAAAGVGIARAAFEEALAYAKEREQFGEPIIRNQAISFMLSEMLMKIDTGRQLYYKASWLADQGKPNSIQASNAKAYCAEMCMDVTTNAVEVLGGNGCTRDYALEKYMRDAKIISIYEGTNEIQRLVLSASLRRVKEWRQY
ncbi:MAG: acyl-CoA dehydrogenase family protein [Actinobacteria bacterium]|nr:acyl-CoA dehydrogenase family protein [Actinomycetota bacterium]